jgi:acetoacetyl-CoA synthetase
LTELWRPSENQARRSQLEAFRHRVEDSSRQELPDYAALHRWSIDHRAEFWQLIWDVCEVRSSKLADNILANDRFLEVRWFAGARLNFAENLLRRRDDRVAIVSVLESGARREVTWLDLHEQTARLARAMRALGVRPGDRVAAWMPNVPETVIAMLAAASIGAIFSSCSPDFGTVGALDRFGQIEPKLLIACDGYFYNGKRFEITDKVTDIASQIPSIKTVLWVSVVDAIPMEGERLDKILNAAATPHLAFEQLPFDHPLYILYSSGTTGKPKCIVHGAGGTLLQHLKEHRLHLDLSEQDTLFFFTTAGWMMWNWLASALATGCRIVLYDGSPFFPNPSAMFDLAVRERVSVFGVSAKFLQGVENHGVRPRETHDLAAIRMLISTGSTLPHEGFRYVYRDIKTDLQLVSMSGGTDLISCFILGNPLLPVFEGELQSAGLGMAVEVWDDDGRRIHRQKGELSAPGHSHRHPSDSGKIGTTNATVPRISNASRGCGRTVILRKLRNMTDSSSMVAVTRCSILAVSVLVPLRSIVRWRPSLKSSKQSASARTGKVTHGSSCF